MALSWSTEYEFTKEAILKNAPASAGLYEILQSPEYSRYEGKTRVVEIGMSESDLQTELLNHLTIHTTANRLARIRGRVGIQIFFRFATMKPEDARISEKRLLRQFEDKHWDLPVLNSQRGYSRGEDRHHRNQ